METKIDWKGVPKRLLIGLLVIIVAPIIGAIMLIIVPFLPFLFVIDSTLSFVLYNDLNKYMFMSKLMDCYNSFFLEGRTKNNRRA